MSNYQKSHVKPAHSMDRLNVELRALLPPETKQANHRYEITWRRAQGDEQFARSCEGQLGQAIAWFRKNVLEFKQKGRSNDPTAVREIVWRIAHVKKTENCLTFVDADDQLVLQVKANPKPSLSIKTRGGRNSHNQKLNKVESQIEVCFLLFVLRQTINCFLFVLIQNSN